MKRVFNSLSGKAILAINLIGLVGVPATDAHAKASKKSTAVPRISILDPTEYLPQGVSVFRTGEPGYILVSANASSSAGIDRVAFWLDSNLMATITAPPYSTTLLDLKAGRYSLVAKAFGKNGKMS